MEQYNFSEIYKAYSGKIVLYLARFVGRNDAEDLMQEVFIKVHNSINTFKGECHISTWIYRIATNSAIDQLKSYSYKNGRSKTTSLDYIEPLKTQKISEDYQPDIEYSFFKKEMNQCIADYINKLPDNYRAIFLLKEYDSLSFEEISRITELSVNNVKIRLHRAKKKLHQLLLANCSFYYDQHSKLCCDKK
jgi:RNA polymerase sigma-70 factor (ECF subfamily)